MEQKEIFEVNNNIEFKKSEWVDIILKLSERAHKNRLKKQNDARN